MTPSPALPALVLHIGQHKTGSKALQAFLAHNRPALCAQGILYPMESGPEHGIPAYSRSHFRLFALVRHAALVATASPADADAYWQRVGSYCQPYVTPGEFFDAAAEEARRTGAHCLLLSAEDLFDMHTAHEVGFSLQLLDAALAVLAGAASAFSSVRVVVYLRRQDHLLAAQYGQFVKGSHLHDIDLHTFAAAFAPRLDAYRLLTCWRSAFPGTAVVVRPYERQAMPGGIVSDFFRHGLGLPVPEELSVPAADIESTNVSLGRDFIEYIRLLNRRSALGLAVPNRDLVLRVALDPKLQQGAASGIAAWLSPTGRRALLAGYAAGNARIARELLGRPDDRLFAEPEPREIGWTPYPGLSEARAEDITRAILNDQQGRPRSGDLRVTMKTIIHRLKNAIADRAQHLVQEAADRRDLAWSRFVSAPECETVCLTLGPYRNLTTLTAGMLFLHPHCQVLNHAGDRILGRGEVDFLSAFRAEKLQRFIQFATLISTKGQRGYHGGSITLSHAFDPKYPLAELHKAAGGLLRKPTIKCLLWKESLKTSRWIRVRNVDLGRVFAEDKGRVRFLLPIRNPMSCAVSNLNTGLVRLFTGLPENPDSVSVMQAVLEEIQWAGELEKRYPDRIFHFFQHEVSADLLVRMAAFLRIEPLPSWINTAMAALKIADSYDHSTELVGAYKRLIHARFQHLPALQEGLLRFCA